MQCHHFHQRVNLLLDQRLDPSRDPEVQDHARCCEQCASELRGYLLLQCAFAPPPPLPAVSHQQDATSKPTRRHSGFWLVTAATLLIAVLVLQRSGHDPTPRVRVAVNPQPISADVSSVVEVRRIVESDSDSAPTGSFVQPIFGLQLVTNTDWTRLRPVELPFGMPVPEVETEWMEAVADEMGPIKQSMNSTLNLIMRTLST